MSEPIRVDAVVIGAGPAGSTTARHLAMLGYKVTLFHRTSAKSADLPRWESVSPVDLELIRAYHPDTHTRLSLVPVAVRRHWSRVEPANSETKLDRTILLDRNLLDEELRRSALVAGATIANSPIGCVRISRDRGEWAVVETDNAGWRAPFLVDATGRRSVLNMRRNLLRARTLVIETRWSGVSVPKWTTYLEALPSAWLWAARDGSDLVLLSTFVSTNWLSGGKAAIASRIKALLEQSTLAPAGGDTKLEVPPSVREATASSAVDQIGSSYLRVGDASLALDPIASQGCQQALISGFQGAAVVHTCLSCPSAYPLAEKFVLTRLQENIALHLRHTREAYRQQSLFQTRFWSDRYLPEGASFTRSRNEDRVTRNEAVPTEWIQLSPLIRICDAPALIGNLIKSVPAVCHPSWAGPVVFFGSQSAADLVKGLSGPIATNRLVEAWARRFGFSHESAWELFNRLWRMGFFSSAQPASLTNP
jgi:flavin-dependent dehydrogenase